jgi:hypothetical protein
MGRHFWNSPFNIFRLSVTLADTSTWEESDATESEAVDGRGSGDSGMSLISYLHLACFMGKGPYLLRGTGLVRWWVEVLPWGQGEGQSPGKQRCKAKATARI